MLLALAVLDVVGLLGIAAACASLLYLGYRIEPHWVAKDGTRFLTVAQELDQWSTPIGRRREVRVRIDRDGAALRVSRRSFMRPTEGTWAISAKLPKPPRGRAVYLLKLVSGDPMTVTRSTEQSSGQMMLRLPASSKVVPILDELLEGVGRRTGSGPEHEPSEEGTAEDD